MCSSKPTKQYLNLVDHHQNYLFSIIFIIFENLGVEANEITQHDIFFKYTHYKNIYIH